MSTVPFSSRAQGNASGIATASAAPQSRASAPDPGNSREDLTSRNACTSVLEPQEVLRPRVLRAVVKNLLRYLLQV